jgi:DNA-binding YbaB/EbfC family protein
MQSKLQEDIETIEVEGASGGGMVATRMNGKKQLLALTLAPEAYAPADRELLEDLIVAAVNDAGRKVDDEIARLTQGMTSGLKIPGLS